MPRTRRLVLLAALALARPAVADTVLVCGAASPVAALSREAAADIYLGRSAALPGGIPVTPVDLPAGSVRDRFYAALTGKNPAQIRAYWSRLVFTGRALPPREAASVEEALAWVAANPGFVAYVPEDAAGEAVRILLRLP